MCKYVGKYNIVHRNSLKCITIIYSCRYMYEFSIKNMLEYFKLCNKTMNMEKCC